ncbi:hypothetical protein F5Y10DRAFT_258580 [Nemania abortiva]|nr:hypothetical protein F5Y10DRAFT_258580 [Nemania abortiva]
MSEVPLEVFYVPLFERKWVKYIDRPEAQVFLVKSTENKTVDRVNVWWTREGYSKLKKYHPDLPDFDEYAFHGGFINGRPLLKPSVPIFTCAGSARPRILYRVVHKDQPDYGLRARGYGRTKATPELFQALVDKHLIWKARNRSPFISTTNSWGKVQRMIKALQEKGLTGVRVVVFRFEGVFELVCLT